MAERHQAAYVATRVGLLLARLYFAAGRAPAALRLLEPAALRATRSGYHFPQSSSAKALLQHAAGAGGPASQALASVSLGGVAAPADKPHGARSSLLRLVERSGARLVDETAAARLRASPPPLLLDLPRQQLVVRRRTVDLAGRRILVPLLLALFEHPERWVDADQLHRSVWGVDRYDEAARTRLKVAISRARSLLGAEAIETARETDTAGLGRTRFRLSPRQAFAVLSGS